MPIVNKSKLYTKIFLDSADPQDTQEALLLLGYLDGQTTNPTLMAKNPQAQKILAEGVKLTENELMNLYKETVQEISRQIPSGSVSIEVNANNTSSADGLYRQALEMNTWIPNAHIKFPTYPAGLNAAHRFTSVNRGRVNMTLGFSQEQAAAVYSATLGATKGQVFYSSFIGRLFDNGIDGVSNLKNVIDLLKEGDKHIEVLACSFRTLDQFLACLQLKVDIVTVSLKILKEWAVTGFYIPNDDDMYEFSGVEKPKYLDFDLNKPFIEFDIDYPLTNRGIASFEKDWNSLIVL
jgi:transaldolase